MLIHSTAKAPEIVNPGTSLCNTTEGEGEREREREQEREGKRKRERKRERVKGHIVSLLTL